MLLLRLRFLVCVVAGDVAVAVVECCGLLLELFVVAVYWWLFAVWWCCRLLVWRCAWIVVCCVLRVE